MRSGAVALALVTAAALAGCERGVDHAPAPSTTASGSPAKAAASGARDAGQAAAPSTGSTPGTGLHGGLGATDRSTSAMGSGPSNAGQPSVAPGTANRTTGSSVGNR